MAYNKNIELRLGTEGEGGGRADHPRSPSAAMNVAKTSTGAASDRR